MSKKEKPEKTTKRTTKRLDLKKETLADLQVKNDEKVKGGSPIRCGSLGCASGCSFMNK